MFFKTVDLKISTIFTKAVLSESIFNKLALNFFSSLLKKRLQQRYSPVNIAKLLRTAFVKEAR